MKSRIKFGANSRRPIAPRACATKIVANKESAFLTRQCCHPLKLPHVSTWRRVEFLSDFWRRVVWQIGRRALGLFGDVFEQICEIFRWKCLPRRHEKTVESLLLLIELVHVETSSAVDANVTRLSGACTV